MAYVWLDETYDWHTCNSAAMSDADVPDVLRDQLKAAQEQYFVACRVINDWLEQHPESDHRG